MRKYFFLLCLPVMLVLALTSCSDSSDSDSNDTKDTFSKEGLWMVTYYKSVTFNLTDNKLEAEGVYTYDIDIAKGDETYGLFIFDVKAPNEKGSHPADIYEPGRFAADGRLEWEKARHETFFTAKFIASTMDRWSGYKIISVTENNMTLSCVSTWEDVDNNKLKSTSEVVLTRISAIPGEVVTE